MKKIIAAVLAFLITLPTSLTVSSATGDNTLKNPAFELAFYFPETDLETNNLITVGVYIQNIVPNDGLTLLHFLLYYDKSKVEPFILNDEMENRMMDDFLIQAPDLEEWKSGALCKLNEEEGYYDISFMTAQNSGYAKEDASLVFNIPFRLKASANGAIEFRIPSDSTTYGVTGSLQQVIGMGDLSISIIGGDIPLVGALSISGIGMPGQTLTANVIGKSSTSPDLLYYWYADNYLITSGSTYTVKDEDVGKIISVRVYGTNNYNGVILNTGVLIANQINTAPPSPSLYKKGANSIMLQPYACCEYKIEGGNWQSSPIFDGLTAGNTYTFYVRYKTPAGSPTAPASAPFTVKLTNNNVGLIDDESSPDYGYLCGLPEKLTYEKLIEAMGPTAFVLDSDENLIEADQYIGTGMIFFNGTIAPIVIKGDVTGDGKVNSIDALRLKKFLINTYTLEDAYLRAACTGGREKPNQMDYLRLKKHLLGTYNLYDN